MPVAYPIIITRMIAAANTRPVPSGYSGILQPMP